LRAEPVPADTALRRRVTPPSSSHRLKAAPRSVPGSPRP